MTDTMTSQNIDLSSWDTLFSSKSTCWKLLVKIMDLGNYRSKVVNKYPYFIQPLYIIYILKSKKILSLCNHQSEDSGQEMG
jgi:hypothetical protein